MCNRNAGKYATWYKGYGYILPWRVLYNTAVLLIMFAATAGALDRNRCSSPSLLSALTCCAKSV